VTYPKGYTRVSTVCDAISRLESEGLTFAGATWAAERAQHVAGEVLTGNWQNYSRFIEGGGENELGYFKSRWFYNDVKGGVVQRQQASADRGTLCNLLWDAAWEHGIMPPKQAYEFLGDAIETKAEEAKVEYARWQEAVALGLVEGDDGKPERGYQCTVDEVWQFADPLLRWMREQTIYEQVKSQVYLQDDNLKVCGTCDSVGLWAGKSVVLDLKTSTSAQPKRSHRAQVYKYGHMLTENGVQIEGGMLLIVTPETVSPRMMTEAGFRAGETDFLLALTILNNSSLKGSFETASQTNKKEKQTA